MEMNWVDPMRGWVGKYLVTQAEYEAVMGSNPSLYRGPRRPVDMVSWNDAMAFCRKLTDQNRVLGKLPVDCKYSLPSDAQYDSFVGEASLDDAVTSLVTKQRGHADVGTRAPNEYGLYDTRGNMWEWCLDWYDQGVYEQDSSPYKAETRSSIGEKYKVLRGGSWLNSSPEYLTLACRRNDEPDARACDYGFRVVAVRLLNGR